MVLACETSVFSVRGYVQCPVRSTRCASATWIVFQWYQIIAERHFEASIAYRYHIGRDFHRHSFANCLKNPPSDVPTFAISALKWGTVVYWVTNNFSPTTYRSNIISSQAGEGCVFTSETSRSWPKFEIFCLPDTEAHRQFSVLAQMELRYY